VRDVQWDDIFPRSRGQGHIGDVGWMEWRQNMDSVGVAFMFLLYVGLTVFFTVMVYRFVTAVEKIANVLDKR
jgi:hypothetical protein